MKFKPSPKNGGVVVELSPQESQLPAGAPFADFHIKKILVPVDFSDCSKKALMYAVPFAKQFDATITVVHIAPYCVQPSEVVVAEAQLLEANLGALNNLVREISGSAQVEARIRVGNPASEIVELAAESQTDLIIISTHGKSGLLHVLMGSTAEKVVRHAPCPVLVVREKEHEFVSGAAGSFTPAI